MAKKRSKKTKKKVFKKSKATKKTVKSSFKEKRVKYTGVKSSVSPSKDPELDKELKELETHKYFGQKAKDVNATGEKIDKPVDNRKIIFIILTIIGILFTLFFLISNNWFLVVIGALFSFVSGYNITCGKKQ